MKNFKVIKPEQIIGNPFQMIGQEWMLISAARDGQVNTMTACWGGLGLMWGMDVAYIAIRESRYTKEFVDAAETFSLTFMDEYYREQLNYLGGVSGRDEPKIRKSGLTVAYSGQTPYFEEGRLILICRKIYHQPFDPACFLHPAIAEVYPDKDYHTLYLGEVTQVLAESE